MLVVACIHIIQTQIVHKNCCGPGESSRCSDLLRAGRPGVRIQIPVAERSEARICGLGCWECEFESLAGMDVCVVQ